MKGQLKVFGGFVLVLLMGLSLAACGGKDDPTPAIVGKTITITNLEANDGDRWRVEVVHDFAYVTGATHLGITARGEGRVSNNSFTATLYNSSSYYNQQWDGNGFFWIRLMDENFQIYLYTNGLEFSEVESLDSIKYNLTDAHTVFNRDLFWYKMPLDPWFD